MAFRTAKKPRSFPKSPNVFDLTSKRFYVKDSPHLDFRRFVETLHEDGDLAIINDEVDPHLEIAAITRRVYECRAKAPLFNNVKGSHEGLFRILGASGGLSKDSRYTYGRLARHIGLPRDATLRDIINRMLSAKHSKPIQPIHVSTGPCKEMKILLDDVDLTKLPVPLLNRADGGNYILLRIAE